MDIRVCAMKLWVVLHITAWALHPCSSIEIYGEEIRTPSIAAVSASDNGAPENAVSWDMHELLWREYSRRRYFYVHNETQIAMARAEADAARHDGGGAATSNDASPLSSIPVSGTFPDFPPSEDGCNWNSVTRDLSSYGSMSLWGTYSSDTIDILAVDSCAGHRSIELGYEYLEFCSQKWVKPEKPDILIRDNLDPLTRSFNVLVKIRSSDDKDVLADGVYFPATGKMHLVGCSRKKHLPDYVNYSDSAPPMADDFFMSSQGLMNVSYEVAADSPLSDAPEIPGYTPWIDPDTYHDPPLNSSTPEDCAISVTVQYPPLNPRWNTDRVVKYSIRSKREKDDPLYFEPIERSAFFPYARRYFEFHDEWDEIQFQRRLETGGRILLLVIGLVCLALQIEHGRNNEESLPFVSLVMLGIQLAHHLSQTSIFKDVQIGEYRGDRYNRFGYNSLSFPGSMQEQSEYNYYGTMAWSEHVPYQAMAMAAIFMYIWIFHRVGDRRRIMKVRVLRKRPGARDPPSDWRVMYGTLAFFCLLCFLGFFAIGADRYGHIRTALTGLTTSEESFGTEQGGNYSWREEWRYASSPGVAPFGEFEGQRVSPFVSWRFYELSQAQWGFVNKLTGVVVSFFLVPQLLGNMQWEVQGRPLSAWFYVGIPFLQSLPHLFSIAKHFQLLPIFPFFDPYINSTYGIYENPTLWWQIGVVVCSTLQVVAVHSQFSRSLIHASWHSNPRTSVVQTCDML